MAKGRKRLIAGWTLLAVAGVMAAVVVASRWWIVMAHAARWEWTVRNGFLSVDHRNWDMPRTTPASPTPIPRWEVHRLQLSAFYMLLPETATEAAEQLRALPEYRVWSMLPIGYFYHDGVAAGGRTPTSHTASLVIVAWPFVAVVAAPAGWVLVNGVRARRRSLAGLCPTCGYDLSATPTISKCPECGGVRGGGSSSSVGGVGVGPGTGGGA